MLTLRTMWIAMFWAAPAMADDEAARKIIATQCVSCHGAAKMGGLDLRERESMLKGGRRGAAVIPGKAEESLLFQAVQRKGSLAMPPGKTGLSDAEVVILRTWIDGGAKWSGQGAALKPAWWSFQKLKRPAVPAVAGANPIDAFVSAKLAQLPQFEK